MPDTEGFDEFCRGSRQRLLGYVYLLTGDRSEAQGRGPGGVCPGLAALVHRPRRRAVALVARAVERVCLAANPGC